MMKRKSDEVIFSMKLMKNCEQRDMGLMINEASLIAYLQCDELIKVEDMYHFQNNLYMMLEYMDQGSIANILAVHHMNYSEEFCKYSLYKVAKGLFKMHQNNVLHRDIRSDNIHCSSDGEVKIADFGNFKILSE